MQIDPYLTRPVSQGSEGQDDRLSLYPFIYIPCFISARLLLNLLDAFPPFELSCPVKLF